MVKRFPRLFAILLVVSIFLSGFPMTTVYAEGEESSASCDGGGGDTGGTDTGGGSSGNSDGGSSGESIGGSSGDSSGDTGGSSSGDNGGSDTGQESSSGGIGSDTGGESSNVSSGQSGGGDTGNTGGSPSGDLSSNTTGYADGSSIPDGGGDASSLSSSAASSEPSTSSDGSDSSLNSNSTTQISQNSSDFSLLNSAPTASNNTQNDNPVTNGTTDTNIGDNENGAGSNAAGTGAGGAGGGDGSENVGEGTLSMPGGAGGGSTVGEGEAVTPLLGGTAAPNSSSSVLAGLGEDHTELTAVVTSEISGKIHEALAHSASSGNNNSTATGVSDAIAALIGNGSGGNNGANANDGNNDGTAGDNGLSVGAGGGDGNTIDSGSSTGDSDPPVGAGVGNTNDGLVVGGYNTGKIGGIAGAEAGANAAGVSDPQAAAAGIYGVSDAALTQIFIDVFHDADLIDDAFINALSDVSMQAFWIACGLEGVYDDSLELEQLVDRLIDGLIAKQASVNNNALGATNVGGAASTAVQNGLTEGTLDGAPQEKEEALEEEPLPEPKKLKKGNRSITHTVSFNMNGGNTDSDIPAQEVNAGGYAQEPATPISKDAGTAFIGWYTTSDGNTKWNFSSDPVTEDITLFAHWSTNNIFTVTFDLSGKTASPVPPPQQVAFGTRVTEPATPVAERYVLRGWRANPPDGPLWVFSEDILGELHDLTLYADWIEGHSVTFDMQGHGNPIESLRVLDGGLVTEPQAPTAEGFQFLGWYQDSACTNPWVFATNVVHSHITLYARWVANGAMVNVTFDKQGHGSDVASQSVAPGNLVAEPSPTPSDNTYTFNGWYRESTCENKWDFALNTAPTDSTTLTLYAAWGHTASFDLQGHGNNFTQFVLEGKPLSEPAVVNPENFTFAGWYLDAECTDNKAYTFTSNALDADITLYA
ncbi:MAG: InlB B-repeat-containing protein, partial [Lachnospiraceae bacterium]|nr:InlB B-repeat-containing protein [Lachnospiraceae bacterium]